MFKQKRLIYFRSVEGGAFEGGGSMERPQKSGLGDLANDFADSMVERPQKPMEQIKADPQFQAALGRVKADFLNFWSRYKNSKGFEAMKAAHPGVLHESMDDESLVSDLAQKIMLKEALKVWNHNQRPGVVKWKYGFSMSATGMRDAIIRDIRRLETESDKAVDNSRLGYEIDMARESVTSVREWQSQDFPFRDYPAISEDSWRDNGVLSQVDEIVDTYMGQKIEGDRVSKCVLFKNFPGEDVFVVFNYREKKAGVRSLTLSFNSAKSPDSMVSNYELNLPEGVRTEVTATRLKEIQRKEIKKRLIA